MNTSSGKNPNELNVILASQAIRLNVNCAVIDTSLLRANQARKGTETNARGPE